MVKKWEKNLRLIEKQTSIDLDTVINDIYAENLWNYDVKKLQWSQNLYRMRLGRYRIIFKRQENENIILDLGSRWDIYKKI